MLPAMSFDETHRIATSMPVPSVSGVSSVAYVCLVFANSILAERSV